MSPLEGGALFAAALGAGFLNAVVGSGTLLTFPILLALGLPPVKANVSNTLGLVPGAASAAWGYRQELAGQGRRVLRLAPLSVGGGLVGAALLLWLPPSAFRAIVPALIVLGVGLTVLQPWLAKRRRGGEGGPLLFASIVGVGVYGGYFGAAQGVLLVAVLGLLLDDTLQRLNAVKNVLAGLTNLSAALFFLAIAEVSWPAVGLIAAGSMVGGQLGARLGRQLPAPVLRGAIVAVGVVALAVVLGKGG